MKRITPAIIIEIGAILRVWQIAKTAPWYDESFTLLVARLDIPGIIAATAGDVHPPLYYLIVSSLLAMVPNVPGIWVTRGFSAICSIASLLVMWKLSGSLGLGWGARVTGLGLLAGFPVSIFYAQEGRMYGLLGLLVVCQVWAMIKRKWFWLFLATLLALYTHNYALFYSAIIGGAGLLRELKIPIPVYRAGIDWGVPRSLVWLLLAMGGAGLGWLPWAVNLVFQMGRVGAGYWIQPVTAGGVALAFYQFLLGMQILPSLLVISVLALGFVAALVLIGSITRGRWLLLLLVLGPLAMAVIWSLIWKPILLYRGLTPSLPMVAMLAGETFVMAKSPAGRAGRWLLVLPWLLATIWLMGSNINGMAKLGVIWPEEPGARVLVHLEDTTYITGRVIWPAATHYLLDSGCPPEPGALTNQTRAALGVVTIHPSSLATLGNYAMVGELSPLSTYCHQIIWENYYLTGRAIFHKPTPYSDKGVFLP